MNALKHLLFTLTLWNMAMPMAAATASDTCSEIRNQLVVLEAAIHDTKLPRCEQVGQKHCCDPKSPLSCQSFLELQTKHNELMGKLVIYEGIISIGQAMESDHSAIQKLELKDLRGAKANVEDFLASYKKAAFLDSSLEADFWFDEEGKQYKGMYMEELEAHIEKQCKRDSAKIKSFCHKLENAQKDPISAHKLKMALANFVRADGHARLSPADRFTEYENYRKALQLSIGGKLVSYDQDHPQIQEIERLGDLLEDIDTKPLSDDDAKKVLEISKNLDGISVNYGELVKPTPEFKDFYDTNISKPVAGFNQASRALLGKDKMLENMDKLKKVFSNNQASAMTSIEENIKKRTDCTGSGESLINCFKRECAADVEGECSQSGDQRKAQSLHTINHQLKALDQYAKIENKIEKATQCLQRPVGEAATRQCTQELSREIGMATKDGVNQLRTEMIKIEMAMENMNNAKSVDELKLSKAMGLQAYRYKGCLSEEDKIQVSEFNSVCSREPLLQFSQEAISLSSDTGAILEFSQNPYINEDLEIPAKNYAAYKTEFLRRCRENHANQELCEMYENDDAVSGKAVERAIAANRRLKASRTASQKLPSKVKMDKVESADPAVAFLTGLGRSALTQGVPFFLNYSETKRQHNNMMSYYNNRLSYMQNQYDWAQANSTVPVYYHPYTNYGYSLYSYDTAADFGGTNSSQLYRYPNDYTQFSFQGPLVMDQYGNSGFSFGNSTTGTTTGANGSTNTSDGFNFNQ